jgi:hypothetical protein
MLKITKLYTTTLFYGRKTGVFGQALPKNLQKESELRFLGEYASVN